MFSLFINEDKFALAKKFGCDQCVNPNQLDEPFKSVAELFQSYGELDYSFECIGNVKAIETAFRSLNRWGVCVVVGLPPKGFNVSVDPWYLLSGQKLTGSFFGGYKPREGIEYLVDKHLKGNLDLDAFITHRIKLEDFNHGFELMRKGLAIRVVIENGV